MVAPAPVIELVERFARQREAYRSDSYNETRLRREFLDPFFLALGWDMENRRGHAEPYKDVIHEDSIKVGAGTRAPDYCFRIASMRKFFVEAKRPLVNIKADASPAYQLRRYAWTAKLPVSILTDFEEFAVYDCRIRPRQEDKTSVARTKYMTFDEYPDRWDEIASVFSYEAVLKGSFDAYAEKGKGKRGTTEVDDAFLAEIEHWREVLARNIADRNRDLSQDDLNFAVQRTIDRIIFLRICEDRAVEDYGRLQQIAKGPGVYARLVERFQRADERYNSGLFHFQDERGRAETRDRLTPSLKIDDKVLKGILEGLYYPVSPYEFSVLSADILGHVYEQFLGKVIRLTPAHHAKIEEKPEVRKAGGVYYTPEYIVRYIVERTLGALLANASAADAARVRVLDPACGSGSFLLGAYQYLLDWHLRFYSANEPEAHSRGKTPAIFRGRHGEWRLTAQKKKEILLNSIYGVDIDAQAIEVTKLSLLLKVLEGETEETVNSALKLFNDRALPDLGNNIRHGNSLIAPDIRTRGQLRFDLGDEDAATEFDWEKSFPKIFKDGGFDVVIGNPPYLSFAGRQAVEIPDHVRQYYSERYESSGWPTAHSLFFERAVKTLSRRFVSFIVPDQVGHLVGYTSIREIAARESTVTEVRYWGEHVFQGVTTPALTFVTDRRANDRSTRIYDRNGKEAVGTMNGGDTWTFASSAALVRKLHERSFSLGKLVGDCGIRTTAAKEQVFPLGEVKGKHVPVLEGKRIQRYVCNPAVVAVKLDSRAPVHVGSADRFRAAAFLIRQTAAYPIVGPHEHATHFRNSLLALFQPTDGLDVKYLVALLNSKLLRFAYMTTVREAQQRAFPQVKVGALQALPIRRIDLSEASEKEQHDDLVALVDRAMETQRRIAKERNPVRHETLTRAFDLTDAEIDAKVYALYGLAKSEIEVVDEFIASVSPEETERPKSWRPPEASAPVGGPKRGRLRDEPRAKKRASGDSDDAE